MADANRPSGLRSIRSFWKLFLLGALGVLALGFGVAGGTVWYLLQDLPPLTGLRDYQPSLVTRVYSADKQIIGQFFVERRILVPLAQIPKHMVDAVVAVEDARFFEHQGLDYVGIARALVTNFLSGRIKQGASTITQQLARSLFLSPKRDLDRKLREALLALKIEQVLGKDQILELYLNQIYFGHGAYGVQAAAQTYFGKEVGEVTLPEAAFLVGLPKGPSDYSPYNHPDAAKRRQASVLRRMVEEGFLSASDAARATSVPLSFRRLVRDDPAPYFVERVRQQLVAVYGETMVNKGGLQVYTTMSPKVQQSATAALQEGLRQLDKRQGYRGPLRREGAPAKVAEDRVSVMTGLGTPKEGEILEGTVLKIGGNEVTVVARGLTGKIAAEDLAWARRRLRGPDLTKDVKDIASVGAILKVGDIIEVGVKKLGGGGAQFTLDQTPLVEGALLTLDPRTGAVLAMVGGYDYRRSEFNRATLARRQPGSAFKPIIYATAVNQGFSPGTPIVDSGAVYNENDAELTWRPENYEQKFYGQITVRDALTHSRNAATVRLLEKVGIRPVLETAESLGITSPLAPDLSLALGSSGVTLQELTGAYGTFLNQGIRLEPYLIESVLDANGNILETHLPEPREALPKETAYLVTNMMEDVIQRGTAQLARGMGRSLAGKTGTTNDFTDAWFLGGAPNLVTGVWVGFDDIRTLGTKEAGARAALPIWMTHMKAVLASLPVIPFTIPEGIVFAKIDPETGLLAPEGAEHPIVEVFRKGTEPTQQAAAKSSPSQFFKFDQM